MPTAEKEKILQDTGERIAGVKGIYLADLSGMTVEKVSLLRKKCRGEKVQVKVIKNTLLKRAFHAHRITQLDAHLRTYLFTDRPVLELEEEDSANGAGANGAGANGHGANGSGATGGAGRGGAERGSLGIGSLKGKAAR